eukprot:2716595-Pleurochrysis_carterae.AAC.1
MPIRYLLLAAGPMEVFYVSAGRMYLLLAADKVWRRRSEPEQKAVARTAKGSMGTAASKGAMAVCARVKCAEERA